MSARPRVSKAVPEVRSAVLLRMQLRADLPSVDRRVAIREQAGLSQEELADAIGCTRAAVHNWERGLRSPQGEMLDRYVEALRTMQAGIPEA